MTEQLRINGHHDGIDASFLASEVDLTGAHIAHLHYVHGIVKALRSQLLEERRGVHSPLVNELGEAARTLKQDKRQRNRKLYSLERQQQRQHNIGWLITVFEKIIPLDTALGDDALIDEIFAYCQSWVGEIRQFYGRDINLIKYLKKDVRYQVFEELRGTQVPNDIYALDSTRDDTQHGANKVPDGYKLCEKITSRINEASSTSPPYEAA